MNGWMLEILQEYSHVLPSYIWLFSSILFAKVHSLLLAVQQKIAVETNSKSAIISTQICNVPHVLRSLTQLLEICFRKKNVLIEFEYFEREYWISSILKVKFWNKMYNSGVCFILLTIMLVFYFLEFILFTVVAVANRAIIVATFNKSVQAITEEQDRI